MDELKNIAPKLSKISREAPFRVPEGYFENFPDRIQAKIQEGNSINTASSHPPMEIIAPKLSKIKSEAPFRVPEGYFERLPGRIQAKIQNGNSKRTESSPTIIRILKPVIGLAASIVLVFLLVYWPLTRVNNDLAQNEVIINELDNYYQIISDLDDNTFYSLMDGTYEVESFTDEELFNYISRSYNEYEIYYLAENLQ